MCYTDEAILGDCAGYPRILLMEDEAVLARGFRMALREGGYDVDLATSGQNALHTMRRKEYHLLVADLRLPDMDGLDVVRRVRRDNPETRVIVITGHADVASAVEVLKAGAVDYLPKPLTEECFVASVEAALRETKDAKIRPPFRKQEDTARLIGRKEVLRMLEKNDESFPTPVAGAFAPSAGVEGIFREAPVSPPAGETPPDVPHIVDPALLLHQDKMMTLGRLAASIVHEINNPLSGILNYIRLIIKIMDRDFSPAAGERARFMRYLTLVESEVGRCADIVSSLLAFSRKKEVRFEEIDIDEVVEKCLLLSRHKLELEQIRIQTGLKSGGVKVRGDFNQLQQCLINLIFNAIDAMGKGGVLTLNSAYQEREKMMETRVADDGCGIAREDLDKIFNPFFTTKQEGKGLGLGLSTVARIISDHGGTIDVESEAGKGTVFTIKLPTASDCIPGAPGK